MLLNCDKTAAQIPSSVNPAAERLFADYSKNRPPLFGNARERGRITAMQLLHVVKCLLFESTMFPPRRRKGAAA
jgi:hypothetical protein